MDNFTLNLYNPPAVAVEIGAWYRIRRMYGETVRVERLRCVACYTHHVLFESENGIRQSIRWWDLRRAIV